MPATPDRSIRTIIAGVTAELPSEFTGVRWASGTIECRARLEHPAGSLVVTDGEIGEVLTRPDVACDTCSDACAG